jgi:N-acetylmuramoyl-L-alanine amidase
MRRVNVVETRLTFKSALKPRQKTRRFTLHWPGRLPAAFNLDHLNAEMVHDWHLERGWAGIGYHYLIRTDGSIERGRPRWALGAHDEGENADSIGICVAYQEAPSAAALDSLVDLLAELADIYGLFPDDPGTVDGHRDNEPPETPTECPGDVLYDMRPEICRRARAALGY